MRQLWHPTKLQADLFALQMSAERAGCALACQFSCSDEFEADMIRARISAGIYERRRRYALFAGAAMSAFAVLVWMS